MVEEVFADDPKFFPLHDFIDFLKPKKN